MLGGRSISFKMKVGPSCSHDKRTLSQRTCSLSLRWGVSRRTISTRRSATATEPRHRRRLRMRLHLWQPRRGGPLGRTAAATAPGWTRPRPTPCSCAPLPRCRPSPSPAQSACRFQGHKFWMQVISLPCTIYMPVTMLYIWCRRHAKDA